MSTERDVNNFFDDFLCVERHLLLSMEIGEYKVTIAPHKAHFLVTVYQYDVEQKQDWFNTWTESFDAFQDLCNKYMDVVMYDRMDS